MSEVIGNAAVLESIHTSEVPASSAHEVLGVATPHPGTVELLGSLTTLPGLQEAIQTAQVEGVDSVGFSSK